MARKGQRSKVKLLLAITGFILLLGAVVFAWNFFHQNPQSDWDDDLSQDDIGWITYEGKQYGYNANLTNILFIGIDSENALQSNNVPGEAGQSDCLMLLTMDKETKKFSVLQIPRDTMTEIDLYGTNGNVRGTIMSQIATQFAYSTGGKSSCWATKKTVSELLYGIPIDGCLAMDYTNIEVVVDALGGIEMTIPKDYTDIDPAFVEGARLKLTGRQVHDYVRYRDTDKDFSNNDRMERQRQFVPALFDALHKMTEVDFLFSLVEKNMITDLDEDEIKQLLQYEFAMKDITVLPGEHKKGKVYEEFYLDEKKVEKILIEMFYILKE